MKKLFRITCTVVSLAFTLATLVACSANSSTATATKATATEAAVTTITTVMTSTTSAASTTTSALQTTGTTGAVTTPEANSSFNIFVDNEKIEPHKVLRYLYSFDEVSKQWISADGIGMFKKVPEYIYEYNDSIPAVNSKNISFDFSSNVTLSKMEIYKKSDLLDTYELEKSITFGETDILADAQKAFSSLPEGTHYVALMVSFTGNFIESDSGGRYEGSGYIYYFKIVI